MPLEPYAELPKAPEMLNEAEFRRLFSLLAKFVTSDDNIADLEQVTLLKAWTYFVGLAPRSAQRVFCHFLNDQGRLNAEAIAKAINRPKAQDRLRHQVIADLRTLANILDPSRVESLYLPAGMVDKLQHLNVRTTMKLSGQSRIDLRQRANFSPDQIDQAATSLASQGKVLRFDPPIGSGDYGLQALLIGGPDEVVGIRSCNALRSHGLTMVSQILPRHPDLLILTVRGFGEKGAKHLQDRLRDRLGIVWPPEAE